MALVRRRDDATAATTRNLSVGLLLPRRYPLLYFSLLILLFYFGLTSQPIRTFELIEGPELLHLHSYDNQPSFPSCSASQLEIIRHQLPPEDCHSTNKQPWLQQCSFSYATRCPDAVWLKDYYYQRHNKPTKNKHIDRPFLAMYIGCNKGMDAVNTLRMGSGNAAIDKNLWRSAFLASGNNNATTYMHPAVCQQEAEEQFLIPSSFTGTVRNPQVHCIEAMPSTARQLGEAARKLGWEKWLIVQNVAMNDKDGTSLFPNHDTVVGIENKGIISCKKKELAPSCKEVPMLRLDTYAKTFGLENATIDMLSVDVEGFDWAVILGGFETLARTNYLEFEYNWMARWRKYFLKESLSALKDHGFICYWPGRSGHIWRLTDCWQDYYNLHFWSNVACVKAKSQVELANRMEHMFLQTLERNRTFQYNKFDLNGP